MINETGQFLLIKRGTKPALDQWSVPGGKQQPGETLTEACHREVYEETGVEIKVNELVAVVERRIEGFHYVIMDFLAKPCANQVSVVPASDAVDAKWVGKAELSRFELVEGLMPILLAADLMRRTGLAGGLVKSNQQHDDFLVHLAKDL